MYQNEKRQIMPLVKSVSLLATAILVLSLAATSCASGAGLAKRTDTQRSILHGYLSLDGAVRALETVSIIGRTDAGKSVEKTARIYKGGYFFFSDLEPGMYDISGMKAEFRTVNLSNFDYLEKHHFVLSPSTIYYYGKLVMTGKTIKSGERTLDLEVVADPDEATALKLLTTYFAKTDWEALINERLSSL